MARLSIITAVGVLAAQAVGASIRRSDSLEPFYEHDAGVPADCNLWWNSDDGFTCETALLLAGVSVDELTRLNPSIKSCSDWVSDRSYCIQSPSAPPAEETSPVPVPPTSTSTAPNVTPTPTQPPNGVETPSPAQPGMVDGCNRFHLVKKGDTCGAIASKAGVTVAQLAQWNKEIGGTACTGIWVDYYVCTGVLGGGGGSPTEPAPPANPTPQPIQDGMVDNCNRFHKVESGDTCGAIASKSGVTVAQLAQWNTGIGGTACTGMWLGYYLCTGVEGGLADAAAPGEPDAATHPGRHGRQLQEVPLRRVWAELRRHCPPVRRQSGQLYPLEPGRRK
ncbi:hypothetical protein PG989_001854 [Apiospora arundinis]